MGMPDPMKIRIETLVVDDVFVADEDTDETTVARDYDTAIDLLGKKKWGSVVTNMNMPIKKGNVNSVGLTVAIAALKRGVRSVAVVNTNRESGSRLDNPIFWIEMETDRYGYLGYRFVLQRL